jgi:hypothetical protein
MKGQVEGPPSERFAHSAEERQVGGAGEEEPPRLAAAIDRALDGQQEAGAALDLVDGDRLVSGDQGLRIALGRLEGREVVERQVAAAGEGRVGGEQRRLARLTKAGGLIVVAYALA